MAELIRTKDGALGFGDYTLFEKTKQSDFEFEGNIYKCKSFKELTRLEKNDMFLYESEPGTRVEGLKTDGAKVSFSVEGDGDTQITLGLEDATEYKVKVGGRDFDTLTTGVGGKLSIAVELEAGKPQDVVIERK
ncbi:MAG: endosialidase [Lachnospiraceae bacterium]|jgi:hypothetical protein|nr:endosialidase [Lachnospiraceae bacterium]